MTNWRKFDDGPCPRDTPIDMFAVHSGPLTYGARFPSVRLTDDGWFGYGSNTQAKVGPEWTPTRWRWIDMPSIDDEMLAEIKK